MLRVGVVGVGTWGQNHARIYASLEDVKLAAVADLDGRAGAEIAARFKADFYGDYRQLLGRVDAVSVAVPTADHFRVASFFLENGIHVLVEKPMTATLEEADRLIELAERRKTVLQVGHLERFNPAVRALRPVVNEPKFFEAHRLGIFAPRSLDIDVVLDLMIHDLDIILSLVGSEVADIRSVGIPILSEKIDIANARLEFENGCVANLTASRVSSEKIRKLRFFQPNSYISLDYERQSVAVYSLVPTEGGAGRAIVSRMLVVEPGEPLRAQLESFVQAVSGGREPECSGREGREALAVALQVLARMRTA